MILSDGDIRKNIARGFIKVSPKPEDSAYQPASLEVTLGERFILPWEESDRGTWTDLVITPGEFVLGTTAEYVEIPDTLVAQVNGKSSWARKGLQVHATAGFIDPGFKGEITLELYNMSSKEIWLHAGDRIAQLVFMELSSSAERPYGHPGLGSHYQYQTGPTRARNEGNGYIKEPLPGL